MKEHLLANCFPVASNAEPIALYQGDRQQEMQEDFCLECLLKVLKVGDRTGLLSRVNYYFPKDADVPVKRALHHAEMLNHLLMHSKVFVIQDIDGDRSYSLRMDTLLDGDYAREDITRFFDEVTQDVAALLQHFGYRVGHRSDRCVDRCLN